MPAASGAAPRPPCGRARLLVWAVAASSLVGTAAGRGQGRTSAGAYAIVSREGPRRRGRDLQQGGGAAATTESPSIAPVLPSFDGDLDAIYQLALEKAGVPFPTAAPAPAASRPLPSDYPSLVPVAWPTGGSAGSAAPFGGQGSGSGGSPSLGSDAPSGVPSDVPSRTPSAYPSAVFSQSGGGVRSDYPSLVPVAWPTSPPPNPRPPPSSAPSDAPSLVPSGAPTAPPTATAAPTMTAPLNPHSCTDSSTGGSSAAAAGDLVSYLTLTFEYAVETESADSEDVARAVGEGEEALQEMVAPELLSCLNAQASDGRIVALDSLPKDEPDDDETCDPALNATNACSVWKGYMRFFLSDASAAPTATGLIVEQVESVLNSQAFVDRVGTGLLRAHFLRAETDLEAAPAPPSSGGSSAPDNSADGSLASSSSDHNVTPAVLVAVGSAALVVIVGSAYYFRKSFTGRGSGRGNPSSAATQMAGSSFNDTAADLSKGQNSPFSDMLPDSYRFNDNLSVFSGSAGPNGIGPNGSGMSAILEDEEAHSQTSSAIFMSEAGYSEAAGETDTSLLSFDIPKSLYTRVPESPNLLGARRRNGGPLPQALHTDSGEDTSSVSDLEDEAGVNGGPVDSPVRRGAAPLASLLDDYPGGGIGPAASSLSSSSSSDDPFAPDASQDNNSNNNNNTTTNSNNNASSSLLPSADDSMQADDLLLFC